MASRAEPRPTALTPASAPAGKPGPAPGGRRAGMPAWAALALVALGGLAAAAQGAVNAELGERVGNPALGAVVNNLGGVLLVLVGLLVLPSARTGLAALWRARPPWWSYLGGLGGAAIVMVGTYVVPVLGVAVFTIAQVTGSSLGGLVVDRVGLAPAGRLPAHRAPGRRGTGRRRRGRAGPARPAGRRPRRRADAARGGRRSRGRAAGGAQRATGRGGRPSRRYGDQLRRQYAGDRRRRGVRWVLSRGSVRSTGRASGTSTSAASSASASWSCLLVGVRVAGVLRTGLALVAGQLAGALLLDLAGPDGPGAGWPVLGGRAAHRWSPWSSRGAGATAGTRAPGGRLVA